MTRIPCEEPLPAAAGGDSLRSFAIKGGLSVDFKGRPFLAGTRIDLLEAIGRTGSITGAAREVGLSYKAAWDTVDAMNNLSDKPLLIRTPGGQRGGGSHLTEHGRDVVRLYRLMESGYQRLLAQMQAQVHDFDRLTELLRAITMKTSARNQFRGTIKSVRPGAVNADVILDLGEGLEIFANITNEAVAELALKPGREAMALIKASFVLLSPDPAVRISARNRLRGTVTQIIPGSVNSEIKIQLAGASGRILTAILTRESVQELGFVEGSECCALIKASHVLLAVND
jgi:molybdate transport system regulatory protein